jgi:long-chain fatty acid transport protein
MKRFSLRKLAIKLCALGIAAVSAQANASGFQLWEQDAASIGNFHAGYAAAANDASSAFYNPAGLTRLNHKQVIFGGGSIVTSFKYRGTVAVNTLANSTPQGVTAQGGLFKTIPMLHYVAPINDRFSFGLSVVVPFGLATNYGNSTIMRYAATESSVMVVDTSPVIAYKVNKKLSIGAGPDFQYMKGEFDQVGTLSGRELDSDGVNSASGTAYGYHGGLLYQFNKDARVGLSYHSQVVHHLTGTSKFTGPLADFFGGPIRSSRAKVNVTLPPYTALSGYYRVHPKAAIMASVIYTQWNTIQNLVMQNVAGLDDNLQPSTNIVAIIPQHFKNTYNVSVGTDYFLTDKVTLRGGLGYDETPVRNDYRNVRLPDNDRYVLALGGHYQATKVIGFDVSWAHFFINEARVNPPIQVTGAEQVTTDGNVVGGADVLAAQIVWDIN